MNKYQSDENYIRREIIRSLSEVFLYLYSSIKKCSTSKVNKIRLKWRRFSDDRQTLISEYYSLTFFIHRTVYGCFTTQLINWNGIMVGDTTAREIYLYTLASIKKYCIPKTNGRCWLKGSGARNKQVEHNWFLDSSLGGTDGGINFRRLTLSIGM